MNEEMKFRIISTAFGDSHIQPRLVQVTKQGPSESCSIYVISY